MDATLRDVQYAVRQLRRQPFFSIVAIATLALAIGLSTALFSVIDAALFRPLPYPHPEELVTLDVQETSGGKPVRYAPSMDDIRRWRALDGIVPHSGMGRVEGFVPLIVDTGTPQRLKVAEASEDFLESYGITPILGRTIQADDTRWGAPAVALLGHAFWQTAFGSDPHVLGQTVRIQDKPVTIVGVLPAGFYPETALWQARQFSATFLDRRGSGTPVIARLRSGVTLAQAQSALDGVTPPSTDGQPDSGAAHVVITSMYDDETDGYRPTLSSLGVAVGLVVLIACVNVAALSLARGASRATELAIRASIGAGRARLVRQLLTESLLLAVVSGLLGVGLASIALDSLVALIPLSLPRNSPASVNGTVLTLTAGLVLATAIVSGLLPALKLSRAATAINSMLTAGGRASTPLSRRTGQTLIATQVALALVLVLAAGLLLRSFARLIAIDRGFDTTHVLTLEVEPVNQSAGVRRDYYAALTAALRRFPGVQSAGAIDQLALRGGGSYYGTKADSGSSLNAPARTVLPGYFETLGVRPVAGRLFEEADQHDGEAVVVNAIVAERYFGGRAVGRTLHLGFKDVRHLHIVGVVPPLRHGSPQRRPGPEIYILPDVKNGETGMRLTALVRLRDGASLSREQLKETAESLGPRVLVGPVLPANAILGEQVATPRHRMILLTMLGSVGLLLTLLGIFSVTAYAVTRRTREIGVRVALGARHAQVVGAIVRDALWPVTLGLIGGLAGSIYATRLVATFLFETSAWDPAALAATVSLLTVSALLSAWLPARGAASVDPVTALRAE